MRLPSRRHLGDLSRSGACNVRRGSKLRKVQSKMFHQPMRRGARGGVRPQKAEPPKRLQHSRGSSLAGKVGSRVQMTAPAPFRGKGRRATFRAKLSAPLLSCPAERRTSARKIQSGQLDSSTLFAVYHGGDQGAWQCTVSNGRSVTCSLLSTRSPMARSGRGPELESSCLSNRSRSSSCGAGAVGTQTTCHEPIHSSRCVERMARSNVHRGSSAERVDASSAGIPQGRRRPAKGCRSSSERAPRFELHPSYRALRAPVDASGCASASGART